MAEHAEAGAHREPAPAGRGAAVGARRAPRGRRLRVADADDGSGAERAARGHRRRVHRAAAASRARVRAAACRRFASAVDDDLAPRQTTAEDAIRGEHQRQGVGQVSVANAITSLRLCATLDWQEYVERSAWSNRCCSAIRPASTPHGFPEPRRAAPRRRRAGDAERRRRRCAWRCKAVESARQAAAQRLDRPIARRTSAITSSAAAAAISRPTSPIGPTLRTARAGALCRATHRALYLGAIAVADRRCCVAAAAGYARHAGALAGRQVVVALLVLLPASDIAHRAASSARSSALVAPDAAAAPRLLRRRARDAPDDGRSCRRC